jgi:hypothetical protein
MRKFTVVFAASSLFAVAQAEERNPLDATLIVDAGWFLASSDMRVRVDGETRDVIGSDIDFENTFGIDDFDRFRAEGVWRFAARHGLHAMVFQNTRRATRTIDREIHFEDTTFPINAVVDAESEFTVAQLSYDYAFIHKYAYEMAIGIGVHYLDLDLQLSGTIETEAEEFSGAMQANAATSAPLPVVGLRALWRLAPSFYLTGQIQYFYLELDQYSGSLLDLKASFVWQFSDHVGVGVAYNDFGLRFDVDDADRFNGRLRWDYGGATVFVSVMF